MERNWQQDLDKPLYRKLPGTGGLRLRKPLRRIKPGERIRITAEELGKYIKEFELLEDPKKKESQKESEKSTDGLKRGSAKESRFKVVPAGNGWFDVLDTLTDRNINPKKYRQNEAEKCVEDLNSGKV